MRPICGLICSRRPTAERDGLSAAIVPGAAARSEVYLRVSSEDPDVRMPPPPEAGLSAAEIATLKQWIDTGGGVRGPLVLRPT